MTPAAYPGRNAASSRLPRAKPHVTAVEDTRPPSAPVTAYPRSRPTILRARCPAKFSPEMTRASTHVARGVMSPTGLAITTGKSGSTTSARTAKCRAARISSGSRRCTQRCSSSFSASASTTNAASAAVSRRAPPPARRPSASTTSAATSVVPSTASAVSRRAVTTYAPTVSKTPPATSAMLAKAASDATRSPPRPPSIPIRKKVRTPAKSRLGPTACPERSRSMPTANPTSPATASRAAVSRVSGMMTIAMREAARRAARISRRPSCARVQRCASQAFPTSGKRPGSRARSLGSGRWRQCASRGSRRPLGSAPWCC